MHEADLPLLRRVYASTRTAELEPLPWTEAQKAAFLDMQFDAQHSHYRQYYAHMDWLVIEIGGRPVGRLYLERDEREHCIVDIALLPDHRGQGLGSALVQDLLDEAAAASRSMIIYVEKFNPALRLYQRLGFVKVEDRGVYDLMRWTDGQVNTAS